MVARRRFIVRAETANDANSGEGQYTMYHPSEVELQESMGALLAEVDRVNPTRVVFDSLSEIRLLAQDPLRYRRQILALKHRFVGQGCTVLLARRSQRRQRQPPRKPRARRPLTRAQIAPIYGGSRRRRLEIVKLRGVRFRDGFHDYSIEQGGIQVYPRLVAAEHKSAFQAGCIKSGSESSMIFFSGASIAAPRR